MTDPTTIPAWLNPAYIDQGLVTEGERLHEATAQLAPQIIGLAKATLYFRAAFAERYSELVDIEPDDVVRDLLRELTHISWLADTGRLFAEIFTHEIEVIARAEEIFGVREPAPVEP
jgi:hypothetical protein